MKKSTKILQTFLILFMSFQNILSETIETCEPCKKLADLQIDNTNLLSATIVPPSDDLPGYCRILGYVRPAINFEIRLPIEGWNGKFLMTGCGGFCGQLVTDFDLSLIVISFGHARCIHIPGVHDIKVMEM